MSLTPSWFGYEFPKLCLQSGVADIFPQEPAWEKVVDAFYVGIWTGLKSLCFPKVWKRSEAELETGGSQGNNRWRGESLGSPGAGHAMEKHSSLRRCISRKRCISSAVINRVQQFKSISDKSILDSSLDSHC